MGRYFFDLEGSGATDSDGETFATDDEAQRAAEAVARDLVRNTQTVGPYQVVVRNEHGYVVHRVALADIARE